MDITDALDAFDERDWPSSTGGTIRFAMVGLGWWTLDFAIPATETLDNCTTTTVVSSSTEKAERVADEHDAIEHALTYDEFHDGTAADAYDAVYIATPNALHLPHAEAAAHLGKDVLCEKPLESNAERARELVEATHDVTVGVEYRMHVEPAVRRMRELIRAGAIGTPTHVHGNMSQPLLDINDDPEQWRLNPDLAGPGGSITDLGIYSLNTARFVLEADPVAVQGATWTGTDEFQSIPDERAAFTVEFPDGVLATCTASQNAHYASNFRVVGTEGELLLEPAFLGDPPALTIDRGDTRTTIDFDGVEETTESFRYFADHVLSGTPIEGDAEHGLVDVEAIDAIYEAAARGERVTL